VVVAKNGTVYQPKDGDYSDKLFSDTPGAFRGMGYNTMIPTRAGRVLELHPWGGWWHLDAGVLDCSSSQYYVYGRVSGTNYSQPCFLRIGEGGWLFCGEGRNLRDEDVAHDLVMLLLHAPWDGEWLEGKPWSCDSESKVYSINGGEAVFEDSVSSGWMQSHGADTFVLRILLVAYDADIDQYTLKEEIATYKI